MAESLAEEITRAYAKTIPKQSRVIQQIRLALSQISEIRKIRARFAISVDEHVGPRIEINPYVGKEGDVTNDNFASLKNSLEYANTLSEASGKRVVIMIDEFQYVGAYKNKGFEGILEIIRVALERWGRNVSFVISGSRVHYLCEVLGNGSRPMFGDFVTLDIRPMQKRPYAQSIF